MSIKTNYYKAKKQLTGFVGFEDELFETSEGDVVETTFLKESKDNVMSITISRLVRTPSLIHAVRLETFDLSSRIWEMPAEAEVISFSEFERALKQGIGHLIREAKHTNLLLVNKDKLEDSFEVEYSLDDFAHISTKW